MAKFFEKKNIHFYPLTFDYVFKLLSGWSSFRKSKHETIFEFKDNIKQKIVTKIKLLRLAENEDLDV